MNYLSWTFLDGVLGLLWILKFVVLLFATIVASTGLKFDENVGIALVGLYLGFTCYRISEHTDSYFILPYLSAFLIALLVVLGQKRVWTDALVFGFLIYLFWVVSKWLFKNCGCFENCKNRKTKQRENLVAHILNNNK
jgi:Ca2+/Na+ antiporter